jgi:hypothetical protein
LGVDVAINIIADPDWDEDRLAAANAGAAAVHNFVIAHLKPRKT